MIIEEKLAKVREALEYLRDWQSKDGDAVVVETAEEALTILDSIQTAQSENEFVYRDENGDVQIQKTYTQSDFDRMVYCEPYIGKDPEFDEWEKLHDPDKYFIRKLKCSLSTEHAMHIAWRKRAEEAEQSLTILDSIHLAPSDAEVEEAIRNIKAEARYERDSDLDVAIKILIRARPKNKSEKWLKCWPA